MIRITLRVLNGLLTIFACWNRGRGSEAREVLERRVR